MRSIGSTTDVRPAFRGRVRNLYPWSSSRPGDTSDISGHGTHVCGSVLGDGESAEMGIKIQGTAPKADLVVQALSLADNPRALDIPRDLMSLFEEPYAKDGALVHTNSWGGGNTYNGMRKRSTNLFGIGPT